MNGLKTLVAAALLTLPLAGCGADPASPPTGQIDGRVVIEAEGIDGISVALSGGASTTTRGGGYFSFTDVEAGHYTITISRHAADASFDATTAEATIGRDGGTVTRNFAGSWIRTASLTGTVTMDGQGLQGITVTVSGPDEARTQTDDNGRYAFPGLRAGTYSLEFSGFETTDFALVVVTGPVSLRVGESRVWDFAGS